MQKVLRIAGIVVVLWGILLLSAFLTMPKEDNGKESVKGKASNSTEVEAKEGGGMADAAHEGMAADASDAEDGGAEAAEELQPGVTAPDMTMPSMPSGDVNMPDVSLPDVSDQQPEYTDPKTDSSYGYGMSDAIAFSADATNEGPFQWGEDYWRNTSYVLHFDGALEITDEYSLSGKTVTNKKMTQEDFDTIMSLLKTVMEEKPFDDIDYSDTMDGTTWGFAIYAPTGAKTYIYGGYTYGCTDLEKIQKILRSYEDQISRDERAYNLFEGEYVSSSDDQKVIRIYTEKQQKFIELEGKAYRLTYVEMFEEEVSFEYEENGKKETIVFTYSPDKKILKIKDEDTPYVRK